MIAESMLRQRNAAAADGALLALPDSAAILIGNGPPFGEQEGDTHGRDTHALPRWRRQHKPWSWRYPTNPHACRRTYLCQALPAGLALAICLTALYLVVQSAHHHHQQHHGAAMSPAPPAAPRAPDTAAVESSESFEHRLQRHGSSVVCNGAEHVDLRRCRFNGLCYGREEKSFFFLHGPHTALVGLPEDRYTPAPAAGTGAPASLLTVCACAGYRFAPALASLSSVQNHNVQHFHFVDMPAAFVANMSARGLTVVELPALLLKCALIAFCPLSHSAVALTLRGCAAARGRS
jgi:hypothetical protein